MSREPAAPPVDGAASHPDGVLVAPGPTHPPGVPDAPAERGSATRRRQIVRLVVGAVVVLFSAGLAAQIARSAGVRGVSGVGSALRVLGASLVLFGLAGIAPVRLALPATLRRHAPLWILPVGACAAESELTVLGYLHVPFTVSLLVVVAAGLLTAAGAVLWPRATRPFAGGGRAAARTALTGARRLGWPLWVALLVGSVALVPMFRAGRPTVLGDGSDAHLAVGTAQFLQHDPPGAIDPNQPVNRVPLVWQSKPPIYYGLAAVAKLARLPTYFSLATLAAFMLAVAVLGFFLLGTVTLRGPPAAALAAMALIGLDRMVLHTVMHPYFNQTCGFALMPWAMVLGAEMVRAPSRRGIALLVLLLGVLGFAYPLALPIPLVFLAGMGLWRRRQRRAAGIRGGGLRGGLRAGLRRIYRGRRSLVWMVPAGLVLLLPILGVINKLESGFGVVTYYGLHAWTGDLNGYFPEPEFLTLGPKSPWPVLLVAMLAVSVVALRRVPRGVAAGVVAVLVFAAIFVAEFRLRQYGYYFHFKVLAFCAPVLLCVVAVGLSRIRRLGPVLLGLWVLAAAPLASAEIGVTFDQLLPTLLALRGFSRDVPAGASIRLDVEPGGAQLWVAYMLAPHPLCSEEPLLHTSYPHVPVSRRAQFVLVQLRPHGDTLVRTLPPFDAVGAPIRANADWALYRMRPSVPGPDTCSRLRIQTVTNADAGATAS